MGDRIHQAKRPVTVPARLYGHPFHPIPTIVPMGAWVGLGFDVASRVADEADVFGRRAYRLIALGILGALVAARAVPLAALVAN